MLTKQSLPWWRTDDYDVDTPVPQDLVEFAGPKGIALVKAYEDGRTQKGWGLVSTLR